MEDHLLLNIVGKKTFLILLTEKPALPPSTTILQKKLIVCNASWSQCIVMDPYIVHDYETT